MNNFKKDLMVYEENMRIPGIIEKQIKDNMDMRKDICKDFKEAMGKSEELDRLRKDEKILREYGYDQWIKNAILKNNAEISLFNYCVPLAAETINKFSGKKLGEKTMEKFRSYFNEISGCSIYFSKEYGNVYSLTVNLLNDDGYRSYLLDEVKFNFNDGYFFSEDGKLLPVENLEAKLLNKKNQYIDDPDTEVKVLKELYKTIVVASEVLKSACEQFNEHAVGNIPLQDNGKNFYDRMSIVG